MLVAVKKEDEKIQRKSSPKLMKHGKTGKITQQQGMYSDLHANNRNGNNGQIQLWQFLLELLTSKEYENAIHWIGNLK